MKHVLFFLKNEDCLIYQYDIQACEITNYQKIFRGDAIDFHFLKIFIEIVILNKAQ